MIGVYNTSRVRNFAAKGVNACQSKQGSPKKREVLPTKRGSPKKSGQFCRPKKAPAENRGFSQPKKALPRKRWFFPDFGSNSCARRSQSGVCVNANPNPNSFSLTARLRVQHHCSGLHTVWAVFVLSFATLRWVCPCWRRSFPCKRLSSTTRMNLCGPMWVCLTIQVPPKIGN